MTTEVTDDDAESTGAGVPAGGGAPAVEAQRIDEVNITTAPPPVKGGGLNDKIVAIQSTVTRAAEAAKPILTTGSDTTKKSILSGIGLTILTGVWKSITSPFGLTVLAVCGGVALMLLIYWLTTRYLTKKDVRRREAEREQREHELRLKQADLDIENAKNLGDPQRLNAVVVQDPKALVVERQ
jgi:hypothetical protein